MKKRTKETLAAYGVAGCLIAVIVAAIYGFSWIVTCGIIKLITMCFGWTFKWSIATGIWLIIILARTVFSHNTTVKK